MLVRFLPAHWLYVQRGDDTPRGSSEQHGERDMCFARTITYIATLMSDELLRHIHYGFVVRTSAATENNHIER